MSWPKLSTQFFPPQNLITCQNCGSDEMDTDRWREHDDADEPTQAVIILCRTCSDRIIEPHPRLYSKMAHHEPHTGSMPACDGCTHRQGTACAHPDAKMNGGNGIELRFPQPGVVFIDGQTKGRRWGSSHVMYHGPVTCTKKEAV